MPAPEDALPGRDTPVYVPGRHLVLGTPIGPPFPARSSSSDARRGPLQATTRHPLPALRGRSERSHGGGRDRRRLVVDAHRAPPPRRSPNGRCGSTASGSSEPRRSPPFALSSRRSRNATAANTTAGRRRRSRSVGPAVRRAKEPSQVPSGHALRSKVDSDADGRGRAPGSRRTDRRSRSSPRPRNADRTAVPGRHRAGDLRHGLLLGRRARCSGARPASTRPRSATRAGSRRTRPTRRSAPGAPGTTRSSSRSSTRRRRATRRCSASSGRNTTRPRACARATTSARSTARASTGRPRRSATWRSPHATCSRRSFREPGYGDDHDRDRRGRPLLLRRGLPPAVPRGEPERLLRSRRHGRLVPDRRRSRRRRPSSDLGSASIEAAPSRPVRAGPSASPFRPRHAARSRPG